METQNTVKNKNQYSFKYLDVHHQQNGQIHEGVFPQQSITLEAN